MAITVIDAGSGAEIQFPDGTSPDTIRQVMQKFGAPAAPQAPKEQFGPTRADAFQGSVQDVRQQIASLPPESRNAALKEWAKTYVGRERAAGGAGFAVDDAARTLARGTPVGSWLDEANAAAMSGLNKISGGRFGAPYDETLAYNRARDEAADANSTKLGSIPVPGFGPMDITAGGLTKLAGGLASAPIAPAVQVMRGASMLPSVVNAAATGGAYGAAYGAGEGETLNERGLNAAIGGGLGMAAGGVTAPVARGVGRVLTPDPRPQGTLAQMDRRGVGFLADDVAADALTAQRAAADAARLGPEATLADMGNNLRTTTGAIARTHGEGRTTIVDTLGRTVREGRRGQADARIQQELNASLGAPVDTVALQDQVVRQANQAARPYYQAFEREVIPDTPAIQRLTQRVQAAPGVMQQAERLMQLETGQPVAMNTGKAWDYIKRAVDDLGQNAAPGSNEARLYKGLSKSITGTIDLMLNRRAGGSDWQTARNLAGVGQQFRSGLEEGRTAFSKGVSADQMRFDLARMRPGERQGFQVGARDSIRQQADNAATMFGATGDAATMRALNTPAAQDKMQQLVGPGAAQRIGNRLNTEADFELTRQAAVGNSVTAEMTAAQRRMGLNTAVPQAETVAGMVKAAAKWAADKMVGGYRDERMRRMTADMARVLMAQGQDRDALIRDLLTYTANRQLRGTQRTVAEGLLTALGASARPLAIEAATSGADRRP